MQGVSTDFKRNLLRGIRWDGEDRALTLEEALKFAVRGQFSKTSEGTFISATSGNGFNVQFALPAESAQYNPALIAAAVSQLFDLYESSTAALTAASKTVTDDTVMVEMLAKLKPRTVAYSDRSTACLA